MKCKFCSKMLMERANKTNGECFLYCQLCNKSFSYTEEDLCKELGQKLILPKCPKCFAPMIKRFSSKINKHFYGCSNFPDCKGSKDI